VSLISKVSNYKVHLLLMFEVEITFCNWIYKNMLYLVMLDVSSNIPNIGPFRTHNRFVLDMLKLYMQKFSYLLLEYKWIAHLSLSA
jgi:hypothetical protein